LRASLTPDAAFATASARALPVANANRGVQQRQRAPRLAHNPGLHGGGAAAQLLGPGGAGDLQRVAENRLGIDLAQSPRLGDPGGPSLREARPKQRHLPEDVPHQSPLPTIGGGQLGISSYDVPAEH
jgi:hypothetical protein